MTDFSNVKIVQNKIYNPLSSKQGNIFNVDFKSLFSEGMKKSEFVDKYRSMFETSSQNSGTTNGSTVIASDFSINSDIIAEAVKMFDGSDKNGNGVLEEEEINKLSRYDNDSKSFSTKDLDLYIKELYGDETQPNLPKTTTESADSAGSTAGSNNNGKNTGSQKTDGSKNDASQNATNQNAIDSMSLEQLKSEKQTREATLGEKQEAVSAIHNGTNPNVKAAIDAMSKAQAAYEEQLKNDSKISEELKNKELSNTQNLTKNQSDIATNASEISAKETEISTQQNTVDSINSTLSSLNSSLSGLPQPTGRPEDKDKDSEISSKKASIEAEIIKKEAEKAAEEQKLQALKDDLVDLKNIKGPLDDEKTRLEQEKQQIQTDIQAIATQETTTTMQVFNEARANVETIKSQELAAAEAELSTAKDSVKEVSTKITDVTNNQASSENSVSSGDLFAPDSSLKTEYVTDGAMKYLLISPKDMDPNEEHPLLVYLHGSGEVGGSPEKLTKVGSGKTILNWDMENFNGYIMYPITNTSWTDNQAESSLRAVISEFSSTHKVNQNQIALAGHSLGGKGAIYMAEHMKDVFCKAAVLSGYATKGVDVSDIDIPIRGYVGSSKGDCCSNQYMRHAFSSDDLTILDAGHGNLPKAAFLVDKDNNNRSDLLEWLFSDS